MKTKLRRYVGLRKDTGLAYDARHGRDRRQPGGVNKIRSIYRKYRINDVFYHKGLTVQRRPNDARRKQIFIQKVRGFPDARLSHPSDKKAPYSGSRGKYGWMSVSGGMKPFG